MKEAQKAIVGAVERTADEGGDMGGFEKTVPRKLAHDMHVVGEAEGRRFRRTAEPRPTGWGEPTGWGDECLRVHAHII